MLFYFIEVLLVIFPLLIAIAYLTLAERKAMGKNSLFGILQPFSDGVKLLMKETIIPSHSDWFLFLIAPIISLTLSFLAWPIIPFGNGLFISDLNISIFYLLAISSLGVLSIIIAGWGGNSKYALSGSIRSAAQMISYEIIISLIILIILFFGESFKISDIVIRQESFSLFFIFPLAPLALIFFISILAETNRAPFDLPEAESELVSGFNTEYSSLSFAMFFLGEYLNIILMSTIFVLFFLGGYNIFFFTYLQPLSLALKTSLLLFSFIWVRATYPRVRFDQLMNMCWSFLLPIVLALFIFYLSILIAFI